MYTGPITLNDSATITMVVTPCRTEQLGYVHLSDLLAKDDAILYMHVCNI